MKYPECEKLGQVANVHATLMQFTEWLEENGYEIQEFESGKSINNVSNLVYQYMKVNTIKLENERRQIITSMRTLDVS